MKRYAISDIHGCSKTFKALIENKIQLQKKDILYLLGDYIDRGPDSKGVIDYIFELKEKGYQVKCLKGNHETLFLEAHQSDVKYDHWYRNGGKTTLKSFDNKIIEKYRLFFENLAYFFDLEDYFLVHAGINFLIENPLEDKESMLWIRKWYKNINKNWLGKKIIIHGHTPLSSPEIEDNLSKLEDNQYFNIDAACVYGGKLCAFELNQKRLFFQKNIDV